MPVQNSATPIPFFQLLKGARFFPREPKIVPTTPAGQGVGRFTEFYCDPVNGVNTNGGSDPGSVTYTATNGNWDGTSTYIPTDGSNPVASGVSVGQFASVFLDGATTAVYIARVLSVVNAANGTIVLSTLAHAGSPPSSLATGRTIRIGGAWKGPNGASGFPINAFSTFSSAQNIYGSVVRVNFKNNASYVLTTTAVGTAGGNVVWQGYTNNPGDGGKAVFDVGATTGGAIITDSSNFNSWIDLILASSAASGSGNGFNFSSGSGSKAIRCVVHGVKGNGFNTSTTTNIGFVECEAYSCATGWTAAADNGALLLFRCYAHDNTGVGFSLNEKWSQTLFCISANNGSHGFQRIGVANNAGLHLIANCDFYSNAGDGINNTADTVQGTTLWIENCNFLKNKGYGINSTALDNFNFGYIYNCGFGSGSMANSGGYVVAGLPYLEYNRKIYTPNTTPWNAQDTGDFSIIGSQAVSAGRGLFVETDGTHSGSVGYPDIGAVQALAGTQIWAGQNMNLPTGYLNHNYEVDWTFSVTGTLSLQSGTLPPGLLLLTVDPTHATLVGIPTSVGTYTFTLRLTSGTTVGDAVFQIQVLADPNQGYSFVGGGF